MPAHLEWYLQRLLRMPLREWSVKVSNGWPDDPVEDLHEPVWAGVVPIQSTFGTPLPTPDLQEPYEPPPYLARWTP